MQLIGLAPLANLRKQIPNDVVTALTSLSTTGRRIYVTMDEVSDIFWKYSDCLNTGPVRDSDSLERTIDSLE